MRKIAYSLIIVLASLAMAACSDNFGPEQDADRGLTFSVTVPQSSSIISRSFASEAINSLYVLVFDENGYFVECQEATPVSPGKLGADLNVEYTFKVKLQASPSRRILHFVANYDFGSNPVEYGTEYSVISHVTVKDGQEAFWQRVVLEKGIVDTDFDSMPEKDKLIRIPLVRNFAQVKVESKVPEFTVTGFALWNVPDRGCVAPYVMAHSAFATYGKNDTDGDVYGLNPWVSRTYDELSEHYDPTDANSAGYAGCLPKDAVITDTDADALVYNMDTKYMYERPYLADPTHTAVIVKGSFKGNKETYFKIDLIKSSTHGITEYYNILRNFTYKVNILKCTEDGYESAAAAAKQPASNNFVFSVVTQDVINISDGETRLYVSTTDTTVVSSDPFKFRYKFVPDFYGKPGEVDNAAVSFYDYTRKEALLRDDESEYYVKLKPPYYVMAEYNVVQEYEDSQSPWYKWHETTITPVEPEDEEKSETVIIYQETTDGSQVRIARSVTFHLRKPFTMVAACDPAQVSTGVGEEVWVNVQIPNGLRESLFPLEFEIEAENQSLTPNNDYSSFAKDKRRPGYMSAWYGKSIIPSKNGMQSFGFKKRLFYSDYLEMDLSDDKSCRIVPLAFKTTKSTSATKIWIKNKYFYFGEGKSTAEFSN